MTITPEQLVRLRNDTPTCDKVLHFNNTDIPAKSGLALLQNAGQRHRERNLVSTSRVNSKESIGDLLYRPSPK